MEKVRIPSWLWHIILESTTDNLGEKGTHVVLRRAGLEQYRGIVPDDDDTPSISLDELSIYTQALFDIFGEEGAKPVLLRIGKIAFESARDRMPPIIKLASKMLVLLPEHMKLEKVVAAFIEAYNPLMNTHGSVFEDDGMTVVEIPDSSYCTKLSTKNPACYVEVGLFSELAETVVGSGYDVKETTCIARGDPLCRFEIKKRLEKAWTA